MAARLHTHTHHTLCGPEWCNVFIWCSYTSRKLHINRVSRWVTTPTTVLYSDLSTSLLIDTDICTLGYHTCSEQATCTVEGNSTLCTCVDDYSGDGLVCVLPSPCTMITCPPNAACIDGPTPRCVCNPGFTGSDSLCVSLTQCEATCNDSSLVCIVRPETLDCGSRAVRNIQEMVSQSTSCNSI